jgi:hypothetical protein
MNREHKVGFPSHEKDGSVCGIDGVCHDKSRGTFQRVVTQGRHILLKRLLIEVKTGQYCRNRALLLYTRNGVGINPLKDGSPN